MDMKTVLDAIKRAAEDPATPQAVAAQPFRHGQRSYREGEQVALPFSELAHLLKQGKVRMMGVR